MFGVIRRILDRNAVTRFYEQNPQWAEARCPSEIRSFFARHPVWKRVSVDLREELSERLACAHKYFKSFDADHAFEIVIGMTELFDVLAQNILPIDRDRSMTTADKLWLIAETFRKLGAKGVREVMQRGNAIDDLTASHALTSSTICLEAAVCVDHYKIDTMGLMALAWVFRSRDFVRANRILAEAEKWVVALPEERFHSVGSFDRALLSNAKYSSEFLRMVRENIEQLRAGAEQS